MASAASPLGRVWADHPAFVGAGVSLVADGLLRAAEQLTPTRAPSLAAPRGWRPWLEALFPQYVVGGFARRHVDFWTWLWAITPDADPDPFVGIWPRGGAKSTSAELGATALGLRGRRRYGLYVRDTQDRADDSVTNVSALFESASVARYYPEHADRLTGKYGDSRGWRRNRIRTGGGFTVDAIGLDTAARGVKLEDQRPDFIVLDDVDGRHDSPTVTEKKLKTITESLLPAGAAHCAVIAIQNLIIPNGVFARLADGRATCLARRIVSGPEPALVGLETRQEANPRTGVRRAIITRGEPTWQGQDRTACQRLLDRVGLPAFLRECQQQVKDREGALWTTDLLNASRTGVVPPLKRVVVGVDPSGGAAEIGIVAAGVGYDGVAYVLDDRTAKGALGPRYWGRAVATLYHDRQADRVVAEVNFGGDMVRANLEVADKAVPVKVVHASRGKAQRAEPVSTLYGEGKVKHVGAFPEMEAEMTSWVPGDDDSPNRLDALVWALTELMLGVLPEKQLTFPVIQR